MCSWIGEGQQSEADKEVGRPGAFLVTTLSARPSGALNDNRHSLPRTDIRTPMVAREMVDLSLRTKRRLGRGLRRLRFAWESGYLLLGACLVSSKIRVWNKCTSATLVG
jgi:hypothetical protein